jgi:hypothetical protein
MGAGECDGIIWFGMEWAFWRRDAFECRRSKMSGKPVRGMQTCKRLAPAWDLKAEGRFRSAGGEDSMRPRGKWTRNEPESDREEEEIRGVGNNWWTRLGNDHRPDRS